MIASLISNLELLIGHNEASFWSIIVFFLKPIFYFRGSCYSFLKPNFEVSVWSYLYKLIQLLI